MADLVVDITGPYLSDQRMSLRKKCLESATTLSTLLILDGGSRKCR